MTSATDRYQEIYLAQKANLATLKSTRAEKRIAKLQKLRDAVVSHADDIGNAQHADMRKMPLGIQTIEVAAALQDIDDAIAGLQDWMQAEVYEPSPENAGNQTYVQYEPKGVVLLFGPWNFPFHLVVAPLVPIIAAGNSCIVKPNEMAPHTSAILAKLLGEVFPTNEVAVVEGGVPVANALLELPVDHIFFTGSPNIGKVIMAAAAKHLASVTLELGGKCPVIIDESADLKAVIGGITRARFFNAGQLCLSTDHIWLKASQRDAFVAGLGAAIEQAFYKDGELNTFLMSRIVDKANFQRLKGYVDDALAKGATIAVGGAMNEDDLTIEPMVLIDVPLDAEIMQHEIFGPILPVLCYENPKEIQQLIHQSGKPLAMYLFSQNQSFIDDMLLNTSSGGVTVNGVMSRAGERRLPFGGANSSGIGRYKGVHGFRELSNARAMFVHRAESYGR
ncbi:aldehyde dehydrogenase family protein [Spongiibacter nanhainus]|uniref:Aldehyde dehydrogenase n=1 Tax=Spongiibacter nanhainus TaxID=2794344 RepID=A0A7T4QZ60_9GAMM|nr:aldehyde dehydrogenase family protein [Spongiibacter nanhainus]QQD17327.1 aldehyde dehydrogenase family protein [Spongiibacter nanhainus]